MVELKNQDYHQKDGAQQNQLEITQPKMEDLKTAELK